VRYLAIVIVVFVLSVLVLVPPARPASVRHWKPPTHRPCHNVEPWLCAKRLAKSWYGWTGAQWLALDALVDNESGWNYCSHYPSMTDCSYMGSNACGIPQATPCPVEWRGHLERWKRQVFWLLAYIRARWGDPSTALWHEQHDTY
jgi:hypothetical protein